MSTRARLADVAARAGVTKSVASRVLNDDPTLSVRPQTRERIHEAAAALGYQPHAGALALAGSATRALAFLVPDLTNPIYARIIQGAFQRARESGYVLLLAEDSENSEADELFPELVTTGRIDGLLLASARPRHRLLARDSVLRQVPHVFVNRAVADRGRNVVLDSAAAGALAADHLLGLGHRRLGQVVGPRDVTPGIERARGFADRVRESGAPEPSRAYGAFSERGGATAIGELLAEHEDITGVYVSTLTQAVGVLGELRRFGRQVPADVSVIATDDLPLAEFLDPPLTTIALPLHALGSAAVEALLAQLNGEEPADLTISDPPELVVRASTAPPPAGG